MKFLIKKKELIFEKSKNSILKQNIKEEKLKNLDYINNIFDFQNNSSKKIFNFNK